MIKNTIHEVLPSDCTGCGACLNKCPVGAITMVPNSEGFLYPQITDSCIKCGQCLKVCPVAGPKYGNKPHPDCYAVMANDEIRKKSTSGGVFTLLAEWILDKGGVVCGAAFSDDNYSVEHIIISSKSDLDKLRGSKYVQSNTGMIYSEVKSILEAGKPVLFTGTPCQIAAVNSYLVKPYANLYTLDLVCHGVPSPMVYEKFIREQEAAHGSKAVQVKFRDKRITDWNHCIGIYFENGESYQKKRGECYYLDSFLKLVSVRKSCGTCPFAKLPRQGDMTVADFWDVHLHDQKLDDRKGTSLVLVNNAKGKEMLKVLKAKAIIAEKAPLEHGIRYNARIERNAGGTHSRRERFFDLISTFDYSIEKAADYSINRRFDIGYVGWWYGANYGSVMTNYALNRVLTDMGKTVLMLEWPVLGDNIPAGKPDSKTRRFVNHFYEQSMYTKIGDYGRFNYHCDMFVLGSDQLWNWWSNRDVGTYHFFLDFVDDQHKKIAYSTSFGHDNAYYPDDMMIKVSYLLNRFDAISVREKGGVAVCRNEFDAEAVQTVDPVFLCSMKAYDEAIALSNVEIDGEYVLAYILNPNEEKLNAIRITAEKLNLPYRIILDGQANFEELKAKANDPNVLENVEIADWLKYFKNASYVVTDSFHGFCYSIIFSRNVTVFPNKLRGLSRFESLSEITGLTDRLYFSTEEMIEKEPWNTPVDYDMVQAKMAPQIEFSVNWLKNALEMEKREPSIREYNLKQLMHLNARLVELEQNEKKLSEQIGVLKRDIATLANINLTGSINEPALAEIARPFEPEKPAEPEKPVEPAPEAKRPWSFRETAPVRLLRRIKRKLLN